MEPNRPAKRVPHVTISHSEPISGELPRTVVELEADFATFYEPCRERVARALAITLSDRDLALDSVDEALVRAYQRWSKVGALDNPNGWVYRVALNHATSRLRRARRHQTALRGAMRHAELTPHDPAIAAALERLSIDHRAVVVCRLLLGWSEADTAEALRIRPGTAKSRLHRAVQRLEHELKHLRPEDT